MSIARRLAPSRRARAVAVIGPSPRHAQSKRSVFIRAASASDRLLGFLQCCAYLRVLHKAAQTPVIMESRIAVTVR